MTDEWTADTWEAAIRGVFRRSLSDPAFRARALTDPRSAFEEVAGKPAPENLKLRFVEALDEHVFVLPKVVQTQGSLSEIDVCRILHHSFRQQSIPPTWSS